MTIVRRRGIGPALAALAMLWTGTALAATNVAVFNFQMKSDTPEWRWLEKGLSDRIATDFVQSKGLSVLARDEMEVVAEKMHWVPEMATTDPARLEELQRQLKIQYLVTGIYSVANGQIKITGQIVEVEGRKEVARKEVSGKADEVLNLQRRLSAELLAWFTKGEPAKILETLPVWTRSLPAAKALYGGMDLYDQGRYAEAWLLFHQASRQDEGYLEAQYWVGKMYYFMNRYEHARRAFERFVYLDTTHPRVQDAIREYLHTYEQVNTPPETLLALYADFQRRFPVDYAQPKGYPTWMLENHLWLEGRTAQVLERMGRHPEAIEAASAMFSRNFEVWRAGLSTKSTREWSGMMVHLALIAVQVYNQLTGKVLMPEGLTVGSSWEQPLRFALGQTEARLVPPGPITIFPQEVNGRPHYGLSRYFILPLVAPDGKMFKKISVYPEIDGDDGKIAAWLVLQSHKDGGFFIGPVTDGRANGIHFTDVQRTGVIKLVVGIAPKDEWRDPKLAMRAVRVVVEWEDVPPNAGAIEVSCSNASTFYLHVDGRRGPCRAGLVGMLSPGEHQIEIRGDGDNQQTPFAAYKQPVTVEAGKTTRVDITLPWKPDSPLSGWSSAALIGRDYAEESPNLEMIYSSPMLQVDAGAIRVFWPHQGDLYMAQSTDGAHFSKPLRLPLPVSSAWVERGIHCIRDESGRFVLLFRSNRDAQHEFRVYSCWSRDAVHWSNPAMVVDREAGDYNMIQDSQGRFVWVDEDLWGDKENAKDRRVTILVSRDLLRWEQLAQWPVEHPAGGMRIHQRHDGTYQVFWAEERQGGDGEDYWYVYCRSSKDGRTWSEPQELLRLRGQVWPSLSPMEVEGRTLLGILWRDEWGEDNPVIRFIRENEDGTWQQAPAVYGIGSDFGSMAWHPRWGYVVVWTELPAILFYDLWDEKGPFLIRGPSVDAFFPKPK